MFSASSVSRPPAEYFDNDGALPAVVSLHQRLDLLVGVPAFGALLENQIRAHAAAREVLDPVVVLGAIGVRIEVARAVVLDVLEKLHQPETGLDVRGAEAEVLIVAARRLIVQIDVKQLAGFPRLRDGVQEVEPGHRFVRDLGVDADQSPDARASESGRDRRPVVAM